MPSSLLRRIALAACCVLAVPVAGCGSQGEAARDTDTVAMREYEFQPRNLKVERGETITVRNDGKIAHNLMIVSNDDPLARPEKLIGTDTFLGGKSEQLEVDLPPGRYVMISSVPGQRQLGMHGTITVR